MKRVMAGAAAAVVAAGLGFSAPAMAQKVIREADKTVYRKKTVVDFSEVSVEGDLTKPEGSYVLNRPKAGFPSRIKLRANFQPALLKSVDAL